MNLAEQNRLAAWSDCEDKGRPHRWHRTRLANHWQCARCPIAGTGKDGRPPARIVRPAPGLPGRLEA